MGFVGPRVVPPPCHKHLHEEVLYKMFGVTALGSVEWISGANNLGLLNLLRVPHYHRSPINLIVIKQLLFLVHNGCLWLSKLILISDKLIRQITLLPRLGLNLSKAFGKKTSEHYLAEKMRDKLKLVKKPCGYSITRISDPTVKVGTQILAEKFMRKCHTDEVSTPLVSLEA